MENEDEKTVKTAVPSVADINAMLAKKMQDPLIGTMLAGGRYEILDVLGEGGMSVVYRAKQALVDRIVAVKTLKVKMLAEPMLLKRFEREVKTLSRLNHPNIVTVFDCIIENGQPYFVMDFLQGCSLQDLIVAEKRLTPGRCKNIFGQVCSAVEHAHRNGIVHRDLKPANIMLMDISGQEFVKVVDFGLAKIGEEAQRLTQTGEIWGSPLYMSPEQCSGHEMDARSDIYSLGSVLYESITGRVPFVGKSFLETIQQVVSLPPPTFADSAPDLKVPAEIEAIVMRCLEKNPDKRYQSMAELKDAMDRVFPADSEAIFRTLPPGKMVVDKAAAEPTKELKRDPQSVIATKRLKRSEMDELTAAEPSADKPARTPAKAMTMKPQSAAKKDGKSTTLMAGVVGGLIAACVVVVMNLISNQPPAAPPQTAPPQTVPSQAAPPQMVTPSTPATTAPAPSTPPGPPSGTGSQSPPTTSSVAKPDSGSKSVNVNPSTSPPVPVDVKDAGNSGGETVVTTGKPNQAAEQEVLHALQGKLDGKPASTAASDATKPTSAKTVRKPAHKVAHSKSHQGSPATIYTPHAQSSRELDDSEIWHSLPK